MNRLTHGVCPVEIGFVLNELLSNPERVSDHCSNVAMAVIEIAHNSHDTHEYLHNEWEGCSFKRLCERFQECCSPDGISPD